eukprot:COSAG06_NODE_858_length_11909_cov_6.018036_18_plen_88_part_00
MRRAAQTRILIHMDVELSLPARFPKRRSFFGLEPFLASKRLVYQDRLGTDMGQIESKEVFFLQAAVVSPPDHTAQGDLLAAEIVCEW